MEKDKKNQNEVNQGKERQDGMFYREMAIPTEFISKDKRTLELSFSSELPYKRYDFWDDVSYDEVLSHAPGAVNLERLEQIGTVLFNHNSDYPIGGIERVWIEENRGKALVRFDEDVESDKIYQKIIKGSLKGVSVGYLINEIETRESKDVGSLIKTATRWEPLEISIVSVPADSSVGVGRAIETKITEGGIEMDKKENVVEKNEVKDVSVDIERMQEDFKKAQEDAIKADRARITEIRSMETQFEMNLSEHLEKGTPVEEVRKMVLDNLAKKQEESKVTVSVETDGVEKFRNAAVDSVVMRNGRALKDPAPGASDLQSMTLRDLMYETLRMNGESTRGRFDEVYRRAMSTSDFPIILGAIANKSVLEGWEEEPSTWEIWAGTGSVTNFHIHTKARLGEMEGLDLIPEGDEYNFGERGETFEQYQVLTYGKKFGITRQAIINDDLSIMTDIPMEMGALARRKVGDLVYGNLVANPKMGDGKNLFHADHHNYVANGGTGAGLPGVETMDAALLAMRLQKDIGGKSRLNISPQYLIAPFSLAGKTEQFFGTTLIGGVANQPNLANIHSGTALTRVYESRLDDGVTTSWYLAAAKNRGMRVFFLDGIQSPFLDRQPGWNIDGMEYKVRIDVGVKVMDYRAMYLNYGQ